MLSYILIFPVALLVASSQIIIKVRASKKDSILEESFASKIVEYLSDPLILLSYFFALLGSFAWLYIVTKLPLAIAFPIYIGLTFSMVLFGGWFFLSEPISSIKLFAILLIFSGIVIGVASDA